MSIANEGALTAADVGAVVNGCRNNDSGWFCGDGIVGLIALLIVGSMFGGFGGFGGGFGGGGLLPWLLLGNGGMGGFGGGANPGYVLTTDMATLERKMDGLANGFCDTAYANAQLIAGVNQNMANGFSSAELSRANQQAAIMQQLFQIQANADRCCCENKAAIADLKYTGAVNTRDIIDNQNANYRALHDEIVANRIADKDAQIAAQNQKIFQLELAASQGRQNEYISSKIDSIGERCPIRAYPVASPCGPLNYTLRNDDCRCNGTWA